MINSKNVYTLTELQAEAAKDGFYLEFDFRPTTDLSGDGVRGTFAARFVPMGYKETPTRNVTRHICGAMGYSPMLGDTCPKCEELLDTTVSSVEDVEKFVDDLSEEDLTAIDRAVADLENMFYVRSFDPDHEAFDKSMKDLP